MLKRFILGETPFLGLSIDRRTSGLREYVFSGWTLGIDRLDRGLAGYAIIPHRLWRSSSDQVRDGK